MSTELTCPVCTAINAFADDQGGRMGKCGKCNTPLYIPRQEELPPVSIVRFTGKKPAGGAAKWVLVGGGLAVALGLAVGGYFLLIPREPALGDDKKTAAVKDLFAAAPVVTVAASASATQEGTLEKLAPENVVKFKAPAAGTMVVTFDAAAGSTVEGRLVAFDAQRKEIVKNDADPDRRVSQLLFPVTADQEYYVKVGGFDGGAGKYKATFTHVTNVSSDFNNALEIRLTKAGSGSQSWKLDPWGDEDMFRVVAPAPGWMSADILNGPGSTLDGLLYVYNSDRLSIAPFSQRVRFYVEKGKTYFVKATSWGSPLQGKSRAGAYTLTLRTDKAPPDDYGNDFTTAHAVTLSNFGPITLNGQIETALDVDFFKFVAPRNGKVSLNLTIPPGSQLDAGLHAYDTGKFSLGLGNGSRHVNFFVGAGQTYYVKVAPVMNPLFGLQKTGAYTVSFRVDNNDGLGGKAGMLDFASARQVFLDGAGAVRVTGQLNNDWEHGLFRIQANRDGLMVVDVAADFGSKLSALGWGYNSAKLAIGPPSGAKTLEFVVSNGGTYYVKVAPQAFPAFGMQKTGGYALAVRTEKIQPDDYGNDFATAHNVTLSDAGTATVSGRIEIPSDQDFFRLKANAKGWLTCSLTTPFPSVLDAKLATYDALKREVHLPFALENGEEIYVKVSSWAAPLFGKRITGAYSVFVHLDKNPPDDYGNEFATAHQVVLANVGSTFRGGRIEIPGDVDFFQFKATATGDLRAKLQKTLGGRLKSHLYVYDENKNLLADTKQGFDRVLTVPVVAGKSYYVKVAANKDAPEREQVGSYQLELTPFPAKSTRLRPAADTAPPLWHGLLTVPRPRPSGLRECGRPSVRSVARSGDRATTGASSAASARGPRTTCPLS